VTAGVRHPLCRSRESAGASRISAGKRQELREQAIFGTPAQVCAELDEYREALGEDVHFIFRTDHPGIGTE